MISFEECCSMCGLSEELVSAIAEHEEIPDMVALELASHLLAQPDGARRIIRIIEDDIARARRRCDVRHEKQLAAILRQFRSEHAGAAHRPS